MVVFTILITSAVFVSYLGSIVCFTQRRDLPISTDALSGHNLNSNSEEIPWNDIRLPKSIIPIEYDIFLHPNLTTWEYFGRMEIKCVVRNTTNFFVLHSKRLVLSTFTVESLPTNETNKVERYFYNIRTDQLYVEVENSLLQDTEIVIKIEFKGSLKNWNGYGFFAFEYFDTDNVTRVMASTMFEPIGARQAFPCFDEPEMKAMFSIAIVRDRTYISLFNMPLIHSTPFGDNLLLDTYQRSVRMSTYLVAFAVCDYASLSGQSKTGINVTVYTPHHKIDLAHYALHVAVTVLDYFDNLFGIAYPIPKLDLIAVPHLKGVAIENWGLIMSDMSALLYDPLHPKYKDMHLWFGNLVTMQWWNDLWLNEGLSTYMSYVGMQAVNDTWSVENEFMMRSVSMNCEYVKGYPPLVHPVMVPDETEFNCMVYAKGGAFINMLRSVLGQENFNSGIKSYIERNKYSSVVTDDLWQALSNDNIDVGFLMDTWVRKSGYPLVTVSRQDSLVNISQSRYFPRNFSGNGGSHSTERWVIPFVYGILDGNGNFTSNMLLLQEESGTIEITSDDRLLKGNFGDSGYYRVNYDKETWKVIIEQLTTDHHIFPVRDRAQLIDDVFSFARAGLLNITVAVEITKYLENESDFLPWLMATLNLKLPDYPQNEENFAELKLRFCNVSRKKLEIMRYNETVNSSTRKLRKVLKKSSKTCPVDTS
ncbi:leucyl-cystinyl aminopeptidase-like isoform X2 [Saccostrea cucullata]|uniref:leucyl-cystinyl aminopeptidase-like isoform X2 n=1 Tax=Saccostrea cuccullata TaxID=36930 RepID=UPI002ED15719